MTPYFERLGLKDGSARWVYLFVWVLHVASFCFRRRRPFQEVDDLDLVLERVKKAGIVLEYGPQTEPWGLKRFFIKDPTGKLINVLEHLK